MITDEVVHKRMPAVAGSFYPAEQDVLREAVSSMLNHAKLLNSKKPKILVAPHAGYIYSGPVAATAYRTLQNYKDTYKTVVLLGPSHRVAFEGLALSSADAFITPLGDIPISQKQNTQLAELLNVQILDKAHQYEHSLEVHLPFLQLSLSRFELVPIVVGHASPETVSRVFDALDNDTTLFVVSSDLSHFHGYSEAQAIDTSTSNSILSMDYRHIDGHMACGCYPLNGALLWAKQHNLDIKLLDLRNSGDTAGDKSRVVGYGSYLIS